MEFKVDKGVLGEALALVSKAISNTAPIPVQINGVLINVRNDSVKLTGSDSDISIQKTLKVADEKNRLEVIDEGDIVLDARYLQEIVRKIDSSIITIEVIDGTFTKISGNKAEYKINGMRAIDYPNINFNIDTDRYKLKVSIFEKIIKQTVFACSDKETRPALMGVNFKADGSVLTCNATNSFRLATKKVLLEDEMHFDITIPAKTLNNVASALVENLDFEMAIDETKVSFIFDDTIIRARLIDDVYPDVSRLIPASFMQTLQVRCRDLLDAVERTSFIKSEGKNVVKLTIDNTKLDISSNSQEIGSSHEELDIIEFVGSPITISCSGRYLNDALRSIGSEIVILNFSGELKPIVITEKDDDTLTQLISPIRGQ